jgi:hypothetical protein
MKNCSGGIKKADIEKQGEFPVMSLVSKYFSYLFNQVSMRIFSA